MTIKDRYYNYENKNKLIDFMNIKETFKYFEDNSIQAISLDYQKDDLSAIIILPKKEKDINKYIQNFNHEKYNIILNGFRYKEVELKLPKFEIEFEDTLNDYFIKLGMKDAFNKIKADFTLMTNREEENLYIDKIIHKTYIKVDEEGTKAAATTAVRKYKMSAIKKSLEIIMKVNHPFLFIIGYKNYMLFITKIEDLGEENNKEIKNKSLDRSKNKTQDKICKSRSRRKSSKKSRSRSRSRDNEE